jgi:carboxyl-terminal processing protease
VRKAKDKTDSISRLLKVKADTTLEREARESTRKQIERFLTTKKSRETSDENFSTFVNTITAAMDPHTNYFPPIDLRSFNESMRGSFYGIGAQLKEDDGKIKIASLVSGGPAWKGGELKPDDEILKIAEAGATPVDVTGYSVTDAVKLIRGAQKGSEVRLTIRKVDGTVKVISIIRDEIKLEETFARGAVINAENKIGYIYLPEFYFNVDNPAGQKCSEDVAKEIVKLKEENVAGIIIDLRGNGGAL